MQVLKAVALKKIYQRNEIRVSALNGIDLILENGEFITIVGKSGSGKSTLLKILGGLDIPTNGFVEIRGENLSNMNREELTIFRRRNIGFVFQNYNLVPVINGYENIVLPISLENSSLDTSLFDEIVQTLEIKEQLYKTPDEMSGGEQQRIAIARALITKPALILADEPTGNLDSETSYKVVEMIKDMAKRFHQTVVLVTHNEDIAKMADRCIQIKDGRILE